jgi:hypothetical protein
MPNQGDWDKWARSVKVDLAAISEYARAVYDNTNDYVTGLDDAELSREIDLSIFDMGKQSLSWFVGNVVLSHVTTHCGEISCLKGIQGGHGY